MATPATTCPNCAQPLTAATNVCPQCGYHITAAPILQTPLLPPLADATPIASPLSVSEISDQQLPPPTSTAGPALAVRYPSAGPTMAAETPDQGNTLTPTVTSTHPPQAISPTITAVIAVSQASLAPNAKPVRFPRSPRLVLALLMVLAIVGGGAIGISHYLPFVPRFIQASQPTSTVAPVGAVLFHDPLTARAHDWTNDQHCAFASDGYHVRDGYECYAPTAQQHDITLSVQARQVSGPTDRRYGLGFRLNAAGDEYLFAIDGNGHWLFGKYIAGVFTTIIQPTASTAIKQGLGSTNTLTVHATGSHFTFAINGASVGAADDDTLDTGYCGVEGSRGIEIVFTNLTIVKAA